MAVSAAPTGVGKVGAVTSTGRLTTTPSFGIREPGSTTSPTPPTPTTVPPSSSPVLFGVSTPSAPRDLSELEAFELKAQKRVGLVLYFQGWAHH